MVIVITYSEFDINLGDEKWTPICQTVPDEIFKDLLSWLEIQARERECIHAAFMELNCL